MHKGIWYTEKRRNGNVQKSNVGKTNIVTTNVRMTNEETTNVGTTNDRMPNVRKNNPKTAMFEGTNIGTKKSSEATNVPFKPAFRHELMKSSSKL